MGSSVQLTDADRAVLRFAAEHRFVLAAQVAALLGASDDAALRRLGRLGERGLIRRARELHRGPSWHQITAAGLRAGGSDLPTPRGFDLATHRHDTGLGWLMLAARAGRFGAAREVVSERRMRSRDGRLLDGAGHDGGAAVGSHRCGVRLGGVGPNGRDRLHYPDMVLVTAGGHRVAFELELTTKEPARREKILAGYAADRRIDAIVYLVERPAVGRAVERSAARMGISHLVRVQQITPVGGAPVGPARSRARRASRGEATTREAGGAPHDPGGAPRDAGGAPRDPGGAPRDPGGRGR